jgi:histidyl-tRNA synthetase
MPFQAQRGTQDVLPTESHRWQWVEREFLTLADLYGYREIRTPVFEDEGLFTRTSGETSDIVTKQMYNFEDKGGRKLALKPEGTAPVMRSVIEHNLCPSGSVARLCYVTPFYRYERPQKGRLREAHQAGLELVGSPSVAADAEIIEITVRFYERLGLKDLNVLVNSLGRGECRGQFREAILVHAKTYLEGQSEEIRDKALKNPLRLLDSKDPDAQEMIQSAPSVLEFLEPECKVRFEELQCLLNNAGINFTVEPSIVRGLDYYTETVFEVQSARLGAQSSVCGGGRYDGLIKEIGGPPTPSVGVGMGIERALIVLEAEDLLPPLPPFDVFVAFTGFETRAEAFKIAAELRASGLSTVMDVDAKSLKSQLRQADRSGALIVVVVGEEELARGSVVVRSLASSEQSEVPRAGVVGAIWKVSG